MSKRPVSPNAIPPCELSGQDDEIVEVSHPSFEAFLGAIPKQDTAAGDEFDIQLIPRDVDL